MAVVDPIMQSQSHSKQKHSLYSSQYSLACFLHNQLNQIINPNQAQKGPTSPLAITGTMGRLHKGHNINCRISVCPHHRRVWVPPSGQFYLWSFEQARVLSCEVRVSCDLHLPRVSATNACRFDIWEPAWWPKACNDTDLIMSESPAGHYCI